MTSQKKLDKAALKKLLIENPDIVRKLDAEKLAGIRKTVNPFNTSIAEESGFLAFSYLYPHKDYMVKHLMTTMIAFLNAAVDEWDVPENVPPVSVYDYVKNPNIINEMTAGWQKNEAVLAKLKKNEEKMKERIVVKRFLEHLFQYNPHEHVKSAYVPPEPEEDRIDIPTPAGVLAIAKGTAKKRVKLLEDKRLQKLMNMTKSIDAKQPYTLKRFNFLVNERVDNERFDRFIGTSKEDVNIPGLVYNIIPPTDVFHNFNKYYEINYEKLIDATNNLYCEINDLEFAVMPAFYSKDRGEVMDFIEKYKEEVSLPINVAQTGKWNIVASVEANRKKTDFISKDSLLLRRMLDQRVEDMKTGKRMMEMKANNLKKKNAEEQGPIGKHIETWKNYRKGQDNDVGGIDLSQLDQDDCPDDEIEVPVFRLDNGGLSIAKNKFNIEAEV